jgi:hypothetical protein
MALAYATVLGFLKRRCRKFAVHCHVPCGDEDVEDLAADVVVKLVRLAGAGKPCPQAAWTYLNTAAYRIVLGVGQVPHPLPPLPPDDEDDQERELGQPVAHFDVDRAALVEAFTIALDGWIADRVADANARRRGDGDNLRVSLEALAAHKRGELAQTPSENVLHTLRTRRNRLMARAWAAAEASHPHSAIYVERFGPLHVLQQNGTGDNGAEFRLKRLGTCLAIAVANGLREDGDHLLRAVRAWEGEGPAAGDASVACATFDLFRVALIHQFVMNDHQ